jgi:hypothetical protein
VDPDGFNLPQRRTLWMYFREGLRRANANRPMSFYLLLAIPVALLLGAGVLQSQDSPKWFVFYRHFPTSLLRTSQGLPFDAG